MPAAKKVALSVGTVLAPKVVEIAPGITSSFVQVALTRAITGTGPIPGAAAVAEKQLDDHDGDVDRAIRELIEHHVAYAAAGGFATNLGGIVTAAVSIPANLTELTVIQARLVAGIAHLRGYGLEDPRVRNAVLVTLLGEDRISKLVKQGRLPAPPMAMATAPVHDPLLTKQVTSQVATEMIARITGKRLALTLGKKVPVVGGVVGGSADAYFTWQIGRYARRELLPRAR
ncbi:EcsC family protein [Nocardioides nematodiphilus]|uniref:EcsC family protein n=1 Tax=Nocardioides nematodiphilus TaxID=2849669 RepID=UPI001CD9D11A|nr:EcsC family protein [Nocardioides nematodiphilus]MCA1981855.1 EcsC family protein [Nocardioides nematodiphilus]